MGASGDCIHAPGIGVDELTTASALGMMASHRYNAHHCCFEMYFTKIVMDSNHILRDITDHDAASAAQLQVYKQRRSRRS
jgi:hypothetical protein